MGESNPVTGNTCDNVKQRAALIDCLAPDRRVEIEVKGHQRRCNSAAGLSSRLVEKPAAAGFFCPLVN